MYDSPRLSVATGWVNVEAGDSEPAVAEEQRKRQADVAKAHDTYAESSVFNATKGSPEGRARGSIAVAKDRMRGVGLFESPDLLVR